MKTDRSLLEAALVGYETQLASIQQSMQEIRKQLGQKAAAGAGTGAQPVTRTKRKLSAAARKRIAAAQKKRWAEYNRKKAASQ
ncbi:MAG TPA: hypothetical protein VNY05_44320 [Candidatus Acidoferrales bacterium]|nr:hypothetical protein [Candidatus Acidoferrales bacterium]